MTTEMALHLMESSFTNTFQVLHTLGVVSFSSLSSILPPVPPMDCSPTGADLPLLLYLKSNYFRAERTGNDVFYPNLLRHLVQSGQRYLAAGNGSVSPSADSLLDFLLENGFQMSEASLLATEAILESYIDEINYDWRVYSIQRRKFHSLHPPGTLPDFAAHFATEGWMLGGGDEDDEFEQEASDEDQWFAQGEGDAVDEF